MLDNTTTRGVPLSVPPIKSSVVAEFFLATHSMTHLAAKNMESSKEKRKSGKKRSKDVVSDAADNEPKPRKKRKVDTDGDSPEEQSVHSNDTQIQADAKAARKEEKRLRKEKKLEAKAVENAQKTTPTAQLPPPLTPSEILSYLSENSITIHDSIDGFVPITEFDYLTVHESLRLPLSNFDKPSPIQASAWGPLLSNNDVIGIAETGR
jgi:superfamily II DNA/RNA helicase